MTTVDAICYKYKPLKTGELPIKIRICKDRKTRYINLGVSTKAEYWDFEKNQPKPICPDRERLEKLIANKISEVRSKIVELKSENKEFTATTLVEQIQSKPKMMTVRELFLQYLQELEQEKRTGYRLSIRQTYNSLIKFNRHLDIPFSEMDCNWLRKYEIWQRKQGKSENTIGIRLRNIRTIFNLAINMGLIKQEDYPFRKFKVFIGYKNMVCCNLCVSTDGYKAELKAQTTHDLFLSALELFQHYSMAKHLSRMEALQDSHLTAHQFAQLTGKCRLYQYLPNEQKKILPPLLMTDTQIGMVAKAYYCDEHFHGNGKIFPQSDEENAISLWQVYNLLTGANKSSYIDNFLDRSLNASQLAEGLDKAVHGEGEYGWFIQ